MKRLETSLLPVIAVLLTAFFVWSQNRTAPDKESSWQDVLQEAESGGYRLISSEELAVRFQEAADLIIGDTRQEWEYRSGHISGALNFPMEPTWWERVSRGAELEALLGPDKDIVLVFY